jgi:integrase
MIVRRGHGYGVRVWDPPRETMRWIGTYPTLAEARRAEAAATLRPQRGRPVSVGEWTAMWLSDYARPAPATQRTYRYAAEQIKRDLGHLGLPSVDRPLARKMAAAWPRGTTRVARSLFGDALRDGLVEQNPFSQLRLETPKGRKDIDALTEAEIHDLATIAERVHDDYGPEAAAIIVTLGYVGPRPGELCVLRRDDLDVGARELTVRFTLDGTGREKPPKNGKPRVVTVPPPALNAIARIPLRLNSPYLFHTPRGRRLSKGSLAYIWRPISVAWREQGGRPITLYWLRHACATLLLDRGLTPGDVAEQLGHEDGGRLVQILYGHPDRRKALDRLKMAFADEPSQAFAPRRRNTDAG